VLQRNNPLRPTPIETEDTYAVGSRLQPHRQAGLRQTEIARRHDVLILKPYFRLSKYSRACVAKRMPAQQDVLRSSSEAGEAGSVAFQQSLLPLVAPSQVQSMQLRGRCKYEINGQDNKKVFDTLTLRLGERGEIVSARQSMETSLAVQFSEHLSGVKCYTT
jgi:hypothetical protein